MASKSQLPNEIAVFPNADRVEDLIESEPNPVVQSLLRLVYGEFLLTNLNERHPEGSVDLLFCFERLQSAFRRKDALQNALKGEFGRPHEELDWT